MKPAHLLIAVATFIVFIATFFISNGMPTGFATALEQPINLQISDVQVHDTKATITWTTEAKALSVIGFNEEQTAFHEATRFSKEMTKLNPGTSYEYTIRACSGSVCEEKRSTIVTTITPADDKAPLITGAVTGAVTGIDGIVNTLKMSANLVIYSLLGIIVLVVASRIGYERFSTKNQMEGMVSRAKRLIENEQYDEAHQIYSKARQAFSELEEEAKLKHYDDLLRVYHSLKKHAELKEAQRLAEKYSNGTITQEELMSLNELIAR